MIHSCSVQNRQILVSCWRTRSVVDLIRIRKATIDDAHIILHHRVEMVRSMGCTEDMISATNTATQKFLQQPWNPSIECYLATFAEKVVAGCAVGFCIAYPSGRNPSGKFAYLLNMFVEPEYRGRGIATMLLRHITQLCQERGIEKMALHDTKMSKGIYEKERFVRSENYYTRIITE
jgi:GNAT superfamily N-acetyltransferase